MTGRKYHYPPAQVVAHLLPHKFRELLFIAQLRIIFRNNVETKLVRQSAVLVRSLIRGTSWRSAPFAFNHYGLRKGKYLKYCYSIVKELESGIYPLIIFGNEQGVLTGVLCKKISFFFIFILFAQKTARQFVSFYQ